MSKALTREHLILLQGAEYVRSGIRRILPTLPAQQAQALGHLAAVLTHSLKARGRGASNDLLRPKPNGMKSCTDAVVVAPKKQGTHAHAQAQ